MQRQRGNSDKLTPMSRLKIFAILSTLLLSGCWSKDFQEPGRIEVKRKPTDAILNSSFTRVWAATQAALSKFSMLRKDADPSTGRAYVVTDWTRGKSDVLFHGFDVNRMPYVIRYKLFIYLASDPRSNRTRVTIKSIEQYLDDAITSGVDIQGGVYTWIKTDSSSLKENALIEQINKLSLDPQFKVDPAL
ncbi:MAG: hypothetical protein JWQ35_891 [Bacteriovoracaceae bacterium]|nr:hypothetical protein [Bacteriovoracaceae bacterium]